MTRHPAPRWCLLMGLAFATCGCGTVREARRAQRGQDLPAGERGLRADEALALADGQLSLDEALATAFAARPALTAADQAVAAARADLRRAGAARHPGIAAAAGYERATANTAAGGHATHDSANLFSGAVTLDWTLYDFGKTPALVRQSLARLAAAEADRRTARAVVAYDVRAAFYRLCRAIELVQVAEESVRQNRTHLEQVRAFQEVGRRTGYDVTKAEVDLGNAELDRLNAHHERRAAQAALNLSLGLADAPDYAPATGAVERAVADLPALRAAARRDHPELAALRAAEQAASAAVDQAIADLYPALGVSAEYAAAGSGFPLVWNWAAGARSVMELFTAGRRRAQIERAVAELRTARARAAEREQRLHHDLTLAYSRMELARQRLDVTELVTRQAREGLALAEERFRVGDAPILELTDAQVALTRAQADRVNAHFALQTALAEIRRALGVE